MDDFDFGLYDEETIENPIKTEIAIKPVAITQAIPVTTSPSATIDVPIQEPNPSNYTSEQCKMYLGGLSKETTRGTLILTSDTLKEYFLKFGPIAELSLLKDPISAISRGFGFVTFLEPRTLDRVLKQNHIIDHKMIQTKRVIPRAEEDRVEKIYVGGIPLGVDNEELKDFFVKFGEVLDAYIMFDPSTKQSQGWGFVTFNEFSGVEAVLDSNRKARLTIRKKRARKTLKEEPRSHSKPVPTKTIIEIPFFDNTNGPFDDDERFTVKITYGDRGYKSLNQNYHEYEFDKDVIYDLNDQGEGNAVDLTCLVK